MIQEGEQHAREIAAGDRFGFGKNWEHFLSVLNDDRIAEAERAITSMLGRARLDGVRFLDAGSGSGLSSLAARRLGATVVSFDYDPNSVACTRELKRRYFEGDEGWQVMEGSVLDLAFLSSLGTFDVVYSWGVLHHTGQMYQALENVAVALAPGGSLFISIYNDQGDMSHIWTWIKRHYNQLPGFLQGPYTALVMAPRELLFAFKCLLRGRPLDFVRAWTDYGKDRGMSRRHDMIDWVGGYPFEVASPEAIFSFYRSRGLVLEGLTTCRGGLGCNQFVFRKPLS